jgi:hypothetical protein
MFGTSCPPTGGLDPKHEMRKLQGIGFALAVILFISTIMAWAVIGGPRESCLKAAWYLMPGCSMATYESLAGGLIAAGGALFAGWLAWSAVREQVEIERRKLRMADVAAQAARADQVSKAVSELATISNAGQILLLKIKEGLTHAEHPYANRFLELTKGEVFPSSPGSWTSSVTGDQMWDMVCRMRSIAHNLRRDVDREKGMNYNYIMAQANTEAGQAVAEFNAALEALRDMLKQQQSWLADENKRLEELRRATASSEPPVIVADRYNRCKG